LQNSNLAIRIEQMGSSFKITPGFSAVPRGSTVTFKNQTPHPVTLFTSSGSADSLTLSIAPKSEKPVAFNTEGLDHLFLLENSADRWGLFIGGPYVSLADDRGQYALELPAGKYTVTAWHERLPSQSQVIEVKEGETSTLDFSLSVLGRLPEVK
jgi:hypothetical protein